MSEVNHAIFTKDMIKTHTILIPDMLPIHFNLIATILRQCGYKVELLRNSTRNVIDEGLKNDHNDTCYPALLVIGQFMDALKSGKYDPNKTALLISQTGGGCRASNYIHLLRKALSEQFPQVTVLSLNFSGLEKGSAFKITPPAFIKLLYAILYGDLLMLLYNQCKPYELVKGQTDKVLKKWESILAKDFEKYSFSNTDKRYMEIQANFAKIDRSKAKKIKVGIVGEFYV